MKILMISIGTRGDIEPFLAIGQHLDKRGHQVQVAFPEQFRHLAEESGLAFGSLGVKFMELLDSEAAISFMGGASKLKKFKSFIYLLTNQKSANMEVLDNQRKITETYEPDLIVYNGKSMFPILWSVSGNGPSIMVSPIPYMHKTKEYAHIAFRGSYGAMINKGSYLLTEMGLITAVRWSAKMLSIKKPSRKSIRKFLTNSHVIYTLSPAIFKRPNDWHSNMKVLGYHFREHEKTYSPPQRLEGFLRRNKKVLFVTFGSMRNPAPMKVTRLIVEILISLNIPGVVNTADGGLVQLSRLKSDRICFVNKIPYDFILPKIYGIIHHGGTGTTHLGLKNGCPTMIIPHIIDQYTWNNLIGKNQLGPKGPDIGKLERRELESKIKDLYDNPIYITNAVKIAKNMSRENQLLPQLIEWIEEHEN